MGCLCWLALWVGVPFFVTEVGLAAQGQMGIASSQDGDQSKWT
jgi:hypothetical protein